MAGAREDGAELFLAPAGNCTEVVGHIPDGLQVLRVSTLSGAVRTLDKVQRGSDNQPTCAA
jgi:PDZ domain-containing protein